MDIDKTRVPSASNNQYSVGSGNLSEHRFDRMISEVEDYAILLLDPNGIITTWNKGAERIKGYASIEIVGRSHKVFYPPEDIQANLPNRLLQEAFKTGKATHEGWRIKKDGSRFWGSVVITALHNEEKKVTGFLKVTRDLSERKIAEDKFNNYITELKKAEERYHKIISEVQDYAIVTLDAHGKIVDWNKGAEKLNGYSSKEILGKNFQLFYTLEDTQAKLPEKLLLEAAKVGFVNNEGYWIKKDGARFWANVTITALHDEKKQRIGYSMVVKDLTERKSNEDKLSIIMQELKLKNDELTDSEERYHKMIAEVQEYAIILLNTEGDVQNWNAGAELIKGYKASEVVGKNFKIFYTQEDIELGYPDELLREAEIKGRAASEGWRKRKDGSRYWGSSVLTALHRSNGELIGFSKVTRDLTEKKMSDDNLKRQSLELELKNRELEKLNKELSSFAHVVSHDFKEPIRKIQVFANRQHEPGKSIDEIKEYSEKIISSAAKMQTLMEALLSYSLVSNDPNEPAIVDLNEALESAKDDLELRILDTKATIDSVKLPIVKGIGFQFHQMFLNILSNALKFAKPGQPPFITISYKIVTWRELPEKLIVKNKIYYQITFADKGVGFEPEQSNRIFDVFQRLSPRLDLKGTGIGLAIVKRIVMNHDGWVIANSKPNEGATFQIYLPVPE